ncbi:hypothetical protein LguiA_029592 [Lonicera macranthoides]
MLRDDGRDPVSLYFLIGQQGKNCSRGQGDQQNNQIRCVFDVSRSREKKLNLL